MSDSMKNESLKKKSRWGGARQNSGRPAGSMNKKTREKKEAEDYFKQRIIDSIEEIVNSQMNLAKGCQMLFRIDKEKDSKGKEIKSKPMLVTSQDEIESYLAGEYDDDQESYYFITTERPDIRALDSLTNRVFGKPPQPLSNDPDNPLQIGVVILPQKNANTLGTNTETGGSSC